MDSADDEEPKFFENYDQCPSFEWVSYTLTGDFQGDEMESRCIRIMMDEFETMFQQSLRSNDLLREAFFRLLLFKRSYLKR